MATKPTDLLTRLFEYGITIDPSTECWISKAPLDPNGYAVVHGEATRDYGHRIVYLTQCGDIPKGYVIDHRCRRQACINGDHLQAVPNKVNLDLGITDKRDCTVGLRPVHPQAALRTFSDQVKFQPDLEGFDEAHLVNVGGALVMVSR